MREIQAKYLKPVLFNGKTKVLVMDNRNRYPKAHKLELYSPKDSLRYLVTLDNIRVGYFDFAKGDTLFAYGRGDHSMIQLLIDGARYDNPDPNIKVYHTGSCCYCHRELTDPVSVEIGIGPKCRSKLTATVPILKSFKWDVN